MKEAYYLCLVNNDLELLTREDIVILKILNPKLDIWNASESLHMDPECIEYKEFNYARYDTAGSF
jgi:hypothetical protein